MFEPVGTATARPTRLSVPRSPIRTGRSLRSVKSSLRTSQANSRALRTGLDADDVLCGGKYAASFSKLSAKNGSARANRRPLPERSYERRILDLIIEVAPPVVADEVRANVFVAGILGRFGLVFEAVKERLREFPA
jgi:hypothetical protein